MLRNPVSEFSLSRAGKVSGPRPSFKPALEALEERVVLSQSPILVKAANLAEQMGRIQSQLDNHEITAGQAVQQEQVLEQQFQKLRHAHDFQKLSHSQAFQAASGLFQARAAAVQGEAENAQALTLTTDGGYQAAAAGRSETSVTSGDGSNAAATGTLADAVGKFSDPDHYPHLTGCPTNAAGQVWYNDAWMDPKQAEDAATYVAEHGGNVSETYAAGQRQQQQDGNMNQFNNTLLQNSYIEALNKAKDLHRPDLQAQVQAAMNPDGVIDVDKLNAVQNILKDAQPGPTDPTTDTTNVTPTTDQQTQVIITPTDQYC